MRSVQSKKATKWQQSELVIEVVLGRTSCFKSCGIWTVTVIYHSSFSTSVMSQGFRTAL